MLGQQVIDDDGLTFLQHVVGGEDVATKAATGILTIGLKRAARAIDVFIKQDV